MLYLFVLIFSWAVNVNSMQIIGKAAHNAEVIYAESFINARGAVPDNLCDQPKDVKAAICNAIQRTFNFEGTFGEIIYTNKSATYYLSMHCIETTLTFNHLKKYNYDEVRQEMFPCYGRHEPMRADWDEDDHFDRMYLSGGPDKDTVFIYLHSKTINSDIYSIFSLIIDIGMETLQPLQIGAIQVERELKLLEKITYSLAIPNIEVNYARTVANVPRIIDEPDPVCDLDKPKKVALCKLIFELLMDTRIGHFKIDETKYDTHSTECQSKSISFRSITANANLEYRQKMYPCYSVPFPESSITFVEWHLSNGYRINSVLLFKSLLAAEKNATSVYAVIDNVSAGDVTDRDIIEIPASVTGSKYGVLKGIERIAESVSESIVAEEVIKGENEEITREASTAIGTVETIKRGGGDELIDLDQLLTEATIKQKNDEISESKKASLRDCCTIA